MLAYDERIRYTPAEVDILSICVTPAQTFCTPAELGPEIGYTRHMPSSTPTRSTPAQPFCTPTELGTRGPTTQTLEGCQLGKGTESLGGGTHILNISTSSGVQRIRLAYANISSGVQNVTP